MATTQQDFTNTGVGPHAWVFKSQASTDIKVSVAGVLKSLTTDYTISDYTTSGGKVTFVNSDKRGTGTVRVYRDTNIETPKSTFSPGSTIKSDALNKGFEQLLYKSDEEIMAGDIADDAITSAKILDGTIANANISTTAEIAVSKLADGDARQLLQTDSGGSGVEWTSNIDVPGTLDVTGAADFDTTVNVDGTATLATVDINAGAIDGTTIGANSAAAGTFTTVNASGTITGNLTGNVTGNCSGSSGSTTGNALTATTATNFTASANNSTNETVYPVFVDGATGAQGAETDTGFTYNPSTGNLTATKFTGAVTGAVTGNASTATDLHTDTKVIDTAQSSHSADNATYFTTKASDARFYRKGSADDIEESGVPWSGNDSTVATTAAIDKRIIDLVEEVGGFVPVANETSFPAANPDINTSNAKKGGTIVSVKTSSTALPNGGTATLDGTTLTISNGRGTGNAVIITGVTATIPQDFGFLVETTATDHTYAFHRLVPKATEVTVVAGKATELTTCHTNITDINTVGNATYKTKVETVADSTYKGKVETVAGVSSDVTTVANNITDVSNFADLYQIASSAPSTDGGGNALANGDLWYDSSSNKQLKVYSGSAFQAVSPTTAVLDDIAIVSGNLTRTEDLGSIDDELASPTTTSSLETCANNITNINAFANTYFIASSAPSGSNVGEGDLWYDSANNILKYNNGSAWTVTAGAGLSALADDTSPELAANLDCNNKNLTEVATVSGDNLQIDFGSIA